MVAAERSPSEYNAAPGTAQLLTIEQLADRLQVPVWTVRKWRAQGTGPKGIRVGRYVRYRVADVDAWLADLAERA